MANLGVTDKEHIVFTEDLSSPSKLELTEARAGWKLSDSRLGRICLLMTNTLNLVCGTQLTCIALCSLYSFVYMEKERSSHCAHCVLDANELCYS